MRDLPLSPELPPRTARRRRRRRRRRRMMMHDHRSRFRRRTMMHDHRGRFRRRTMMHDHRGRFRRRTMMHDHRSRFRRRRRRRPDRARRRRRRGEHDRRGQRGDHNSTLFHVSSFLDLFDCADPARQKNITPKKIFPSAGRRISAKSDFAHRRPETRRGAPRRPPPERRRRSGRSGSCGCSAKGGSFSISSSGSVLWNCTLSSSSIAGR